MNYVLAILTHGQCEPLAASIAAFRENVWPAPSSVRVFADGVDDLDPVLIEVASLYADAPEPLRHVRVAATHRGRQAGFCAATRRLWKTVAAEASADWVFWLEHDFLVERRVDLSQMADVLTLHPDLAQMALLRQPVNDLEAAAGGLVESRPGQFERTTDRVDGLTVAWLRHVAYVTTNPSLMRRKFMVDHPWPDYGSECEGRFGIDLRHAGLSFGVWGDGVPWVRHVGHRGAGGFGY